MMLVEDNSDSPISKLLKEVFKSDVDFSNGCNRMLSMIKKYSQEEEFVVVFYDYVLDNPDTVQGYNNLVKKVSFIPNVAIVKIPCIEFFALRFLLELGLLKNINKNVELFKQSLEGKISHTERSYEVFCKSVLNGYPLICIHNANKKKVPFTGAFWQVGCPYDVGKCKGLKMSERCVLKKDSYKLTEKCWNFVKLLPCLYTSSSVLDLKDYFEDYLGDVKTGIREVNIKMVKDYYSNWA